MKVAVVTPEIQDTERLFGAERHFVGMVEALSQKADTDWIQVGISERTWKDVLRGYLNCYDLDLSRYDLVISTKTPTFMVQHRNHVCWLLHQIRVYYDRFDEELAHMPQHAQAERRRQRDLIRRVDTLAFQRVRSVFTNGYETARRLRYYNGVEAEVLHPPVLSGGQYCGRGDYFFLPGRLHPWKRVDLAIEAMQQLDADVPLLIAGTGDDEARLLSLAGNDPRIRFLGFASDQEMLELYANALAVLFVPKEEDFGYVTVEAMLSHKPVITCTDSGEPARLVQSGRSGFVVRPNAAELARAMKILADDRELAREMGEHAFQSAPSQSWEAAADRLLQAGAPAAQPEQVQVPAMPPEHHSDIRVLVTDNQVLDPAVGGARVRVKELCQGLAASFTTEYVGAFDWRGPAAVDAEMEPGWRCRVFPLANLHYRISNRLQRMVTGGSVIDVSFPLLTHLSRRFLRALREAAKQSDVVVFTHPWCYPLAKHWLGGKYVIYDSHNFEWGLRGDLLSATPVGRLLARYVRHVEGELSRRSHEIWVCSNEDAEAIASAYGVPRERFRWVPNCADTATLKPASDQERLAAKRSLEWAERPVVTFVGSGYRPNTEAAAFMIEELAPKFPEVVFAIAGSVKEDYFRTANVQMLGQRFGQGIPCCIADGWHDPEHWSSGEVVRWSAPEFGIEMFRAGQLVLEVQSPQRNSLTVQQEGKSIYHGGVAPGDSIITLNVVQPGALRFQLQRAHQADPDPRILGIAVRSLCFRDSSGAETAISLEPAGAETVLPPNVELMGILPEEQLYSLLHASDVALNPVLMGSGTNLKQLQYMAAGLPVISTPAGVRGIEQGSEVCVVTERESFAEALAALLGDADLRRGLGKLARAEAERDYDWGVVSGRAAQGVTHRLKYLRRIDPPFFSVVVPTYNRPQNLVALLDALAQQTFPDFEVVVVDQSDPPVQVPQKFLSKLSINLIHSQERGPALARNKGIRGARGEIVAFTDDDCVPRPDWLERAARHFDGMSIAGLEGRVESCKLGNPRYRTVSNTGFEGIGFMTANMFYRRELLNTVGGFDERFKLAFREDSDLAWRIMEYGEIPHASNSVVFHPPHRVKLERESPAERARMFSADPLLFAKHPQRYIELLSREGHYRNMPGFWSNFARGLEEQRLEPPLERLFHQLSVADPEWWAAVQNGNGSVGRLSAEDLIALRGLLHGTLQRA